MTPRFRRLVFALLALAPLGGCALRLPRKPHKNAAHTPPPAALYVGTVALVNEEGHFALIDSTTSPSPLPDTVLKTRDAGGETAELKAGAIHRRPFAIADVVKGTPKVGDQVFQQTPGAEHSPGKGE